MRGVWITLYINIRDGVLLVYDFKKSSLITLWHLRKQDRTI